MKLVHAADLHLDSPLRGLERYEGAPLEAIRAATRRALENLVELCLSEGAALLLLAGDLYDGDWKDYSTGLFFVRQLARLREANVRVVMIRGNHDAQSQISKHLQLPSNVTELATRKPETVIYEDVGVAVHGQGYAKRAITRDLTEKYPAARSDLFNVALLHTCVSGRRGHASYAPCKLEALQAKGYDYWALGHVHQREVLCRDPWIVFPGNLQGRHIREHGSKGASVVEVQDGKVVSVEHRALDTVRWLQCEVDCSEAGSGYDVVDLVRAALEDSVNTADGRIVAARLILVGASRADAALRNDEERWRQEARASALDVGDAWVEKVKIATRSPLDRSEIEAREDAIGQIVAALRRLPDDDARMAGLMDELSGLRGKLPSELRDTDDDGGLRLDDPQAIRERLADVESLLIARLLDDGATRGTT